MPPWLPSCPVLAVTVVSTIDLWLVEGVSVGTLAVCVVPTLVLLADVTTGAFVPEVLPGVAVTSSSTVAALVVPCRAPLLPLPGAGNVVRVGLRVAL